ncbi:DUF1302 family protein [Parvibaculum sedimenti]|uniref:DUF1302 family protein n=1 Tax=Parvibaculum sedimenti TaxID=2608632 RepID=A0A6N6VQZ0_9HYPH|nr:DUF1302 family protein [Parvibaculum sedimenti]
MNFPVLTTTVPRLGSRALLLAFLFLMSTAGAAYADEFTFGEISVSIDTTVSLGVSTRVSNRDCSHVAKGDGGCPSGVNAGGLNTDDGNLNFDRWDLTGATVKSVSDVNVKWQNSGIFLRPRLYYDAVYAQDDLQWRDLNHDAKQRLDYGVGILDAFAYSNFEVGGHSAALRFGKQVVNWGESTFQRGGINAYQAIDVSAARRPGAELKDIITPMPMVFGSLQITDTLSTEAFWQFGHAETEVDPSGSYFSTSDITGAGSISLNSGGTNDSDAIIHIYRTADKRGSDTDQFGFALRNYFAGLGDGTDTALYFVRYTSKLPYIGVISGSPALRPLPRHVWRFMGTPARMRRKLERHMSSGRIRSNITMNFLTRLMRWARASTRPSAEQRCRGKRALRLTCPWRPTSTNSLHRSRTERARRPI